MLLTLNMIRNDIRKTYRGTLRSTDTIATGTEWQKGLIIVAGNLSCRRGSALRVVILSDGHLRLFDNDRDICFIIPSFEWLESLNSRLFGARSRPLRIKQ